MRYNAPFFAPEANCDGFPNSVNRKSNHAVPSGGNMAGSESPAQERKSQGIERVAKQVKHTVPGTLNPQTRKLIVGEVRAGRSVPQVAKAYSAASIVVLELWLREELRKPIQPAPLANLLQMRRAS
jgi:hypothetical protein